MSRLQQVLAVALDRDCERRHDPGLGEIVAVVLDDRHLAADRLVPGLQVPLVLVAGIVVAVGHVARPVRPAQRAAGDGSWPPWAARSWADTRRRFRRAARGEPTATRSITSCITAIRLLLAPAWRQSGQSHASPAVERHEQQDPDQRRLLGKACHVFAEDLPGLGIGPAELGAEDVLGDAPAVAHAEPIGMLGEQFVGQEEIERVGRPVERQRPLFDFPRARPAPASASYCCAKGLL